MMLNSFFVFVFILLIINLIFIATIKSTTLTSLEMGGGKYVVKAHKYFTLYGENMCVCLATYLIIKYDVLYIYKSLPYPMAIETHTLSQPHTLIHTDT